ncbi:beta-microseminoprotein-like [Pelobates fuscus]|uniref:beta-microseminoprotein-like n=1 Tax=Pelobates fuscus TaxID=191477 RepID=UPI002FE4D9C0
MIAVLGGQCFIGLMNMKAMDYGLGILLALCIIPLCNSQCTTDTNGQIGHKYRTHGAYVRQQKGCIKEGTFYDLGQEWKTNDCMSCKCRRDSISCCTMYSKPSDFDQVHCEAILDLDSCKYRVVKKNDKTQLCQVDAWIS